MGEEIRLAIIGTGNMGKRYAQMLHSGAVPGLRLGAVVCRSEESVQWAEAELDGEVSVFPSEDALYERQETFDAVLVVTPHRLHPAMAIRALQCGKHVLSDKPAAVTACDALAMQRAAEEAGRVYALMCHQRACAKHRKVKELLRDGALGEIERVSFVHTGFLRTGYYVGWAMRALRALMATIFSVFIIYYILHIVVIQSPKGFCPNPHIITGQARGAAAGQARAAGDSSTRATIRSISYSGCSASLKPSTPTSPLANTTALPWTTRPPSCWTTPAG